MILKIENNSGAVLLNEETLFSFDCEKTENTFNISKLKINTNDIPLIFTFIEHNILKDNITKINIFDDNFDKFLLNYLPDLGYSFSSTDSSGVKFSKNISKKKSWRVSLTEMCNYDCFFCHGEGLDLEKSRKKSKTVNEIYDVIKRGIELGYSDITFTGGEPLLKSKEILLLIDMLITDKLTPDLTIVSNGYLLTADFLEKLSFYNGRIKFNISLHSIRKENFYKVTRPKGTDNEVLEKVVSNINKIKLYKKFTLKINFVIMRNINNNAEDVTDMINFGITAQADSIKFLELLITKEHHDLYNYYYKIDGIRHLLPDGFSLFKKELRRDIYKHPDYSILIELQKCSCEFGCAKCLLTRDVLITSELEHFPCFLLSEKSIPVSNKILFESINQGNQQIEKFAELYGDSNPLLISDVKYVTEKSEYYYATDIKQIDKILELLKELGYTIKRKRDFLEKYYMTDFTKDNTLKVLKLYSNSYNQNIFTEVKQDINLVCNNETYSNVRYINELKPNTIHDIEVFENNLAFLNLKKQLELNWITLILGKGNDIISVGRNVETDKIIIMTSNEIESSLKEVLHTKNINDFLLNYIKGGIND